MNNLLRAWICLALSFSPACAPEPEFTYEAEGEYISHDWCGAEVDDGWQCTPDTCGDLDCSHMVYGPYVQPDPGFYRATFRLRADGCDFSSDEWLAMVDIPGSIDNWSAHLRCTDIGGDYTNIYHDFEYTGGDIEMRVLYNYQGSSTVTVDYVRLESRSTSQQPGFAADP